VPRVVHNHLKLNGFSSTLIQQFLGSPTIEKSKEHNLNGYKTRRECQFSPLMVRRLIKNTNYVLVKKSNEI